MPQAQKAPYLRAVKILQIKIMDSCCLSLPSIIYIGKSNYVRYRIIVNVIPLEPEWEGHVTLKFSNSTPLPAKIYVHEIVAKMLFFESDEDCETSHKHRGVNTRGKERVLLYPKRDSLLRDTVYSLRLNLCQKNSNGL